MSDLDSFTQRDEEERKEREAAERKAKEEAQRRAREQEEHAAREAEERRAREKAREAEELRRKEDEAREQEAERAREEKARAEREAEARRQREETERRATAAAAPPEEEDIVVTDEDLDMEDVRRDQAVLSKDARRSEREREKREKEARREAKREAARRAKEAKRKEKEKERDGPRPAPAVVPGYRPIRRRRSWGKPIAMTLFLVLAAGLGALHFMPIGHAEYEQAASQALGRPVRIGTANVSLYKGVELLFRNVSVGDVRISEVRAKPDLASLFAPEKSFSLIELQGVSLPQQALAALFDARLKGPRFAVRELVARDLALTGPVTLPKVQVELALGPDGAVTSTTLRGADGLQGKILPKGDALAFDVVADSFPVPLFKDVWLSGFAMKGSATRDGMRIQEWGGGSLDGGISGSANVRWGENWVIDGVMTVRGINAAVFAPALLSEGKAEGTAKFSLSDPNPMNFLGRGRLEGTFSVHKGVLGSFDLSRAIQTGGRQAEGRTPFTGMNGQGVFDRGAVALRNVSFGAGAMNAGASADISADGRLSGRIVADVTTSSQTLRATLNIGGTVKDPQVRN